jgi:hypothetical protein
MDILTMTLDTDSSVIMSAREPPNDLVGLAAGANTEHDAVAQHQRVALEHAIKAGSFLAAAKDRLPHGRWLPWLAQNCPTISRRTAQVYLQLHYRQADLKCADVPAHLTIDDALKVIAKKKAIEKPARAPAKRETVADLKQQVARRHRPRPHGHAHPEQARPSAAPAQRGRPIGSALGKEALR